MLSPPQSAGCRQIGKSHYIRPEWHYPAFSGQRYSDFDTYAAVRHYQRIIASDTSILVLSALSVVAVHTATNGEYGFHCDELATIDDARFLGWGYVVYPPVTPFIARVSLTLFGASMIGLRFFAALAVGIAMVLTGLMAREIGGRRPAQLVAAWAAVIAGPAVSFGYLFQYVSFDYLWWVLAAWVTLRLLRSEDQRWWLALGAVVGLGMMTKYTLGVPAGGHRWRRCSEQAPLAAQQMVVVRCRRRPPDFPSQSHLAGPARFHHARLSKVHPCA